MPEKISQNEYLITAEEAEEGFTIKLKVGDIIRIANWINKNGTNVLMVAKIPGVYKIHGKIK